MKRLPWHLSYVLRDAEDLTTGLIVRKGLSLSLRKRSQGDKRRLYNSQIHNILTSTETIFVDA